jgi:hypothetical protein
MLEFAATLYVIGTMAGWMLGLAAVAFIVWAVFQGMRYD